jgi:hypothetical protein
MSKQTVDAPTDRLFGILPHFLPIMEVFVYGIFVIQAVPLLRDFYGFLQPIMQAYNSGFTSFLVFILLYVGVVNNPSVSHFIRFNVLQSILIGILASLCGLILRYMILPAFGTSMVTQVVMSAIFIPTFGICIYSMIMSGLGKYAEIPQLSETTYLHLR